MKFTFYIICVFLISSCSFMRKVQKSEVKTDSVHVITYDTVDISKKIDQALESRTSKTTIKETVQVQPIVVDGKTQYVYLPSRETTTDNTELLIRMKASLDSIAAKKNNAVAVSTAEKKKDTEVKAGVNWLMIIALLLLLACAAMGYIAFNLRK